MKMFTTRLLNNSYVTVNGQPDDSIVNKGTNAPEEKWIVFSGDQGAFVNILGIPALGTVQEFYYRDDSGSDNYGNHGFFVSGDDIEGPAPLGLKSYFPGSITPGEERQLGAELAVTMEVSATAQTYDEITGVKQILAGATPNSFELEQNYPNPFNPETEITYYLPEQQRTLLVVYNLIGQEVRTLVDRNQVRGSYTVSWDGTDSFGRPVPSGVYIYRLQAGSYIESKKMMLVK
jgi:hypothetical protein